MSTKGKKQKPDTQLRDLREFIRTRRDWKLAAEYIDRETGTKAKRPEFERMFQDASERKFVLLVFWTLDRLSREGTLKTLQHLKRLSDNGVEWWSLKEEYLKSVGEFSDVVLSIVATIAKLEHRRIAERTRAGIERARAEGKTLGRPVMTFDLAKARALRKRGMSIRAIAATMKVSTGTVFYRLAS